MFLLFDFIFVYTHMPYTHTYSASPCYAIELFAASNTTIFVQTITIIMKKTSIAPISSKRIKLSGAPSTGVGQTHSPGTMQSSSTMIRWQGNLNLVMTWFLVIFQCSVTATLIWSSDNADLHWFAVSDQCCLFWLIRSYDCVIWLLDEYFKHSSYVIIYEVLFK